MRVAILQRRWTVVCLKDGSKYEIKTTTVASLIWMPADLYARMHLKEFVCYMSVESVLDPLSISLFKNISKHLFSLIILFLTFLANIEYSKLN